MATSPSAVPYNQPDADDISTKGRPLSSAYDPVVEERAPDFHRTDSKLKRNIRLFRFIARLLTFILSIYTTYTQSVTLHKYLSTRATIIDGRNAWAKETVIWPTALLLATASLTVGITLITIVAYVRSIQHANKADGTVGTAGTVVGIGAHLAVWVATATAYRVGKTGSDLWGWTCSPKADAIQEKFRQIINFNEYCDKQSNAWFTSIAQAGLAIVIVTVYALSYRRLKHKKRLGKDANQSPLLKA